jgi:hypothetical protein
MRAVVFDRIGGPRSAAAGPPAGLTILDPAR